MRGVVESETDRERERERSVDGGGGRRGLKQDRCSSRCCVFLLAFSFVYERSRELCCRRQSGVSFNETYLYQGSF